MSEKLIPFKRNDGRVTYHKEAIAEIYQKRGLGKIVTKAMLQKEIEALDKSGEKGKT